MPIKLVYSRSGPLVSGFLFLLPVLGSTPSGWAQSIQPVIPRPPEQPQPVPLPPSLDPLQTPPKGPPTPEEVLDVPGTITVQQFEFAGNTAFSQEQLSQATADFIGKPITFAQLLQAANQVTALYLEKGYITSGAYIPAQEFPSGTVKIQVVEGSLEEIEINIVKGRLNPNYVRDRIAVATAKPLNVNRLQEALQLLQLNPLIASLNAELSAGTRPGTNTLEVTVKGADTFNIRPDLNNYRNPSIGTFERSIEVSEANLLGLGDKMIFNYANTDGSNDFEGSYTLPVNPYNGTIAFQYRVANNTIVESPFDQLDIETDSRDFDLTFRQPVIQRATSEVSQELALSLTAARRETDSSILGVGFPLFPGASDKGKTQISALRFTQEWTQRSSQEVLAARSQFSLGINAFNATINDDGPDSQFFLWRGQLLYLHLLSPATGKPAAGPTLLLRSDLQLAADPLLPIEQFSLGGQSTVRGYSQDALLTDNAIFASAEARLPIVRVPEVEGILQIAPFIDFGTGWNTGGGNPNPNTLVGIGFGLLWQMGDKFSARSDWGVPLVGIDSGDSTWQENGFYFQVDYKLF
jgi:hemolysin activation/secretion protein